jgi:hypothetical protein
MSSRRRRNTCAEANPWPNHEDWNRENRSGEENQSSKEKLASKTLTTKNESGYALPLDRRAQEKTGSEQRKADLEEQRTKITQIYDITKRWRIAQQMMKKQIFQLQSKQDYNWSTEVTILSSSFDYFYYNIIY